MHKLIATVPILKILSSMLGYVIPEWYVTINIKTEIVIESIENSSSLRLFVLFLRKVLTMLVMFKFILKMRKFVGVDGLMGVWMDIWKSFTQKRINE